MSPGNRYVTPVNIQTSLLASLSPRRQLGMLHLIDQEQHELGADAEQRFRQLENSRTVRDLSRDARQVAAKLGQESDWVRWRLTHL